MVGIEILQVWS